MDEKIILLVEDNADDEALTVRALKKQNIVNTIVVLRDGAEALDWVFARGMHSSRDPAVLPHVVLLDLRLPSLSGHEVLRAIRANDRTAHLPVVILTSSPDDKNMIESYDRGANSFVSKPVDFKTFVEAVKQLGLYWLLLNKAPV